MYTKTERLSDNIFKKSPPKKPQQGLFAPVGAKSPCWGFLSPTGAKI